MYKKNKSKLLFTWLYNERKVISRIYLLALLQGAMYLAIPLGIQGVVTYIMAGSFSASLILLSSITILVTCFIGFFQIWQMRINETLHQKIFGSIASRISFYLNSNTSTDEVFNKLNKFYNFNLISNKINPFKQIVITEERRQHEALIDTQADISLIN